MKTQENNGYEGWAIVELMGRNVIAGHVSEQVMYGTSFLRVDVPLIGEQSGYTKFFGGTSIYAVTPTTEDIVIKAASTLAVRPVSEWIVPATVSRQIVDSEESPF